MKPAAEIGIFGGSGFYELLPGVEEVKVETPYGAPSDAVALAEVAGRRVAFLPRHGRDHSLPPHMINYRANLWAMKSLGVRRILSPCAAGSLDPEVRPGDIVIMDQLVDRTSGRKDTFYDGPVTTHIAFSEPYCPELRRVAREVAGRLGIPVHAEGSVVVIQGPRYSTRAESRWFARQGWQVVNMTQYPEVALARELDLCVCGLALITDYDAGVEGRPEIAPVTSTEAMQVFYAHNERLRELVLQTVAAVPVAHTACACGDTVQQGRSV